MDPFVLTGPCISIFWRANGSLYFWAVNGSLYSDWYLHPYILIGSWIPTFLTCPWIGFLILEKMKLFIFIFFRTHNSNSDFEFDLVKSEKYKKLFFWLSEVELILFFIFLTWKNRGQKYYFYYFWLRFFEIRKIKNNMSSTSPSQKIFSNYFLEKIEIRIPNSGMPAIFVAHPCSNPTSFDLQ